MRKSGAKRRRKLLLCGLAMLCLQGVSGCREHSAAAPGAQKAAQPAAQQPVHARVATPEEKSCREFVQGFYDWYINGHLKDTDGPPWYDVAKKRPRMISDQLRALLNWESAEEDTTHEIGALDFDPF